MDSQVSWAITHARLGLSNLRKTPRSKYKKKIRKTKKEERKDDNWLSLLYMVYFLVKLNTIIGLHLKLILQGLNFKL